MNYEPLPDPINVASVRRSFASLRKFVRPRAEPVERCELCGTNLLPEHEHLVQPQSRRLLCSCQACALLFSGQAETKYRRVPRDTRLLADFVIPDAQWDSLMIPINLAFFFDDSASQKIAGMYASPAGPVESLLGLDTWQEITQEHPMLQNLQPDVEALLVNRMGQRAGFTRDQYFLAPIDQCYKLVGLLRTHWRGLSGGSEVWNAVHEFFDALNQNAKTLQELQHA